MDILLRFSKTEGSELMDVIWKNEVSECKIKFRESSKWKYILCCMIASKVLMSESYLS